MEFQHFGVGDALLAAVRIHAACVCIDGASVWPGLVKQPPNRNSGSRIDVPIAAARATDVAEAVDSNLRLIRNH